MSIAILDSVLAQLELVPLTDRQRERQTEGREADRALHAAFPYEPDFRRTLSIEEASRLTHRKRKGQYRTLPLIRDAKPLSPRAKLAWDSKLRERHLAQLTRGRGLDISPDELDRIEFDDTWGRRASSLQLLGTPQQPTPSASRIMGGRASTLFLSNSQGIIEEAYDTFAASGGEEGDGYSDTAEGFDSALWAIIPRWETICALAFGKQREIDNTIRKVQQLAAALSADSKAAREARGEHGPYRFSFDAKQQGWETVKSVWAQLKTEEFPKQRAYWQSWQRGRSALAAARSAARATNVPQRITIICEREVIGDSTYSRPDGVEMSLLRDYSKALPKGLAREVEAAIRRGTCTAEEMRQFYINIGKLSEFVAQPTPQEPSAPAVQDLRDTVISASRRNLDALEVKPKKRRRLRASTLANRRSSLLREAALNRPLSYMR